MDRDSKLIFEGYSNKVFLTEEEKESWWQFALKVVDPTGILSYGDLADAIEKYKNDQSAINFCLVLVGIFNALPNFGLLAAGWGGLGWGAVKAALKGAVKRPQELIWATNKALKFAANTPGVSKSFEKGIEILVSKGKMTKDMGDEFIATVRTGKLPFSDFARQSMDDALKAAKPMRSTIPSRMGFGSGEGFFKNMVGIGGKWKALSRAASSFGPDKSGVEYPGWAPQSIGIAGFDALVPASNEQGASDSARRLALAKERLKQLTQQAA